MGKERPSEWYDQAFSASATYHKPYSAITIYLPLWNATAKLLADKYIESVLDIGCGMGHFASLMQDRHPKIHYHGIDFSEYAVEYCQDLIDENMFTLSDAVNDPISPAYEAYVLQEMLEHVEEDLKVIGKIPNGKLVIFTLPTFDSNGHVRWYPTMESILERFAHLFADLTVQKAGDRHFIAHGIRR